MDPEQQPAWRRIAADPRAADAALVVVCLLLTVLAVKTPWSPLPRLVIAVAGVLGSLAQWPRRSHPQVAAVAGAACYALSGNPGPWLLGLYTGALLAPRRHVWAYGVVAWAGWLTWSWIDTGGLQLDDVVFGAVGVALVVAVGGYLAARNALVVALRQRAEQTEAEQLLREERARTAERTRIAREMHDVVAHKVSLIALHAGALELQTEGGSRHSAGLIRITAREALQDLRAVLGVLRLQPGDAPTASIDEGELFADLASLVRASAQAGQPVELRDQAGPLPPATARVVYRVVQEGLTNAGKHAPGAPTLVSVLRGEDGTVSVTVYNEAAAGAPRELPESGFGLVGLAERIHLVGGSLHGGPLGKAGGWELSAVVPWIDHHVAEQTDPVQAP